MSGGSLEYISSRIDDAVTKVKEWLAEEERMLEHKEYSAPHPYYVDHFPDHPIFKDKTGRALQERVIINMKDAIYHLRMAAMYAHEVEWFTSGDIGPESFCLGVEAEIAKMDYEQEEPK